jgi:hypothetical protein
MSIRNQQHAFVGRSCFLGGAHWLYVTVEQRRGLEEDRAETKDSLASRCITAKCRHDWQSNVSLGVASGHDDTCDEEYRGEGLHDENNLIMKRECIACEVCMLKLTNNSPISVFKTPCLLSQLYIVRSIVTHLPSSLQ